MYHYYTGEEVRVGDVVRSNDRPGTVRMVIAPGTQEAEDHGCPEGGVMIEEDWDGKPSLLILTPPDGMYWEDLDFVRRGAS